MTDHDLPGGDDRDLLASLYLDGEASPEEAALVERDPELLARVEDFREARAAVARAPAAPPGAAGAAVRRAIDGDIGPGVVSLGEARARRRAVRWLGPAAVAAVVLLVLVALPIVLLVVGRSGDVGDVSSDAGSGETAEPETTAPDDAASEAGDDAGGSSAGGASGYAMEKNLGPVPDEDALRDHVATALGGTPDAQAPATSGQQESAFRPDCASALRQRDPSLGDPVYGALLTYAGEAALVHAFDSATAPGRTVAVVVRQADCSELTRVTL